MGSIETLIVLSVAAFHFAIVSWGIGADYFVADTMLLQMNLKHGGFISVCGKAVGKFCAVIRLDAFNGKRECFYQMFYEHGRGIGIMFLKGFHEAPSGILVNSGILEELFSNHFTVHKAGRGDKFDVHLNALSGIVHLFVRFRNIFGIWWLDCHHTLLSEETIQPGNRAGIASLPKLNPKDDKTGIWIAAAHVGDKFDLIGGMLLGMTMGTT